MEKNFWCAILILLVSGFLVTIVSLGVDIRDVLNQHYDFTDLIKATPETKIFIYKELIIFKLFCSVIILLLGFFLYFYGKKETTTEQEDTSSKKDASVKKDSEKVDSEKFHFWPWIRSTDGGVFLILFAIFVLLVLVIIKGFCCGLGPNESQFIAVTLSIALAALIPHIISKTIAENAVKPLINEQLEKYKPQLEKNRETALKNTAHSSRMTANILSQIADQQKRDADTLTTDANAKELLYEKALENYFWAIGWGAKAIAQYFLIFEVYPEGITTFSAEIIVLLDELKKKISGEKEFENLVNKNVRRRDLKSVIQAHAFIKTHKDVTFKHKKDGHLINVERILKDVELLLMKFGSGTPDAKKCRMVELDYKGNNELVEKAIVIINEAQKEEAKKKAEEAKKKAEEEAYKRKIEDSRKRVDAIVSSSKDKKESTDTEEQTEQRPDIWY